VNGFDGLEAQLLEGDSRARSRGDDFYRSWRRWTEARLDDLFFEVCRQLRVRTLIECGAHAAEASLRFVAEQHGRVAIALEANPFTFEKKTLLAQSGRVTVINEGLGAEPGRLSLRIPDKDGTGNRVSLMASFLEETAGRPVHTVEVPVTTVDEVCVRFGAEGPIALWIDVEGYGGQVLRGGEQSISSDVDVVVIEVSESGRWVGEARASEVTAWLAAAGFTRMARDCAKSDNSQYNIIFVRRADQIATSYTRTYIARVLRPVSSTMNSRMFFAKQSTLRRWRRTAKRVRKGAGRIVSRAVR
jgi:FkbM family methyltransferase